MHCVDLFARFENAHAKKQYATNFLQKPLLSVSSSHPVPWFPFRLYVLVGFLQLGYHLVVWLGLGCQCDVSEAIQGTAIRWVVGPSGCVAEVFPRLPVLTVSLIKSQMKTQGDASHPDTLLKRSRPLVSGRFMKSSVCAFDPQFLLVQLRLC